MAELTLASEDFGSLAKL